MIDPIFIFLLFTKKKVLHCRYLICLKVLEQFSVIEVIVFRYFFGISLHRIDSFWIWKIRENGIWFLSFQMIEIGSDLISVLVEDYR